MHYNYLCEQFLYVVLVSMGVELFHKVLDKKSALLHIPVGFCI